MICHCACLIPIRELFFSVAEDAILLGLSRSGQCVGPRAPEKGKMVQFFAREKIVAFKRKEPNAVELKALRTKAIFASTLGDLIIRKPGCFGVF
jgi:hypothetical protein